MGKLFPQFTLLVAFLFALGTNSFHVFADTTNLNIEKLLASVNGIKDEDADGPYKNAQNPSSNVFTTRWPTKPEDPVTSTFLIIDKELCDQQ